ncbi:PAS domain-containing sensor histidine kinase [Cytophaga aurantiaca]|uniref:PAS domain-containing sensor histidine kinase n=1 Tax=Cytophaga aurantiaca TaxID=29530 RepID=UPI00037BF0DE|nr:PAS domain-containing sensor histidine kinase [Cytophaga aurantiaca]
MAINFSSINIDGNTIEHSEFFYESLVKQFPCAFYISDLHGHIQLYNQATADLIGRTPKYISDFGIHTNIKTTDDFNDTHQNEILQIVHADGTVFHVFNKIKPIYTDSRELIGSLTILINSPFSKGSKSEHNEHLLKNVYSSSTDCIKVLDLNGRLISMNENGQRIAEIDDISSFIGGSYVDLWMDAKDAAATALANARNGKTGRFVGWLPTIKTNTPKWWDVVITAIPDMFGMPEQLLVVARDITEYTLLQDELKHRNKELLKTNNDLDNFIYTASHDLRSPVTNIEGLLHTLKVTLSSEEPNKLNEADLILELIDKSINKFKRTILDLTEISKVQRTNEEDIHQINFLEIIEDVLFSIQDKVTESGAKITIDTNACNHLIFSTKNFKSIVYNLLSNAIKYRHPERTLEISIFTKKVGDSVLLSIQDNGLGISSVHLPKLFSMFKRFHNHVEGTGIGLYIIKRIIDNAGGEIEVHTELNKGTTFNVYFNIQ